MSPQPPRAARPSGSRVDDGDRAAAVEGQRVVGAAPAARQRGVGVEQLGPARGAGAGRAGAPVSLARPGRRPPAGQPPSCSASVARGLEVDRPAVVGVDQALLPQLAALVDVGHPGTVRASSLAASALLQPASAIRRQHRVEPVGAPRRRRRPRRRPRARPPRTPGRGRSRWCGRRPRASPSRRSRADGAQVWGSSRPGADDRLPQQVAEARVGQRRQVEPGRSSAGSQASGSSASTVIRARTSSPRLVSWVDRVVIAAASRAAGRPSRRGTRRRRPRRPTGRRRPR